MRYLRRKSDGYIYPYSELLLNYKPDLFEVIDRLPSASKPVPSEDLSNSSEENLPDQAVLLGDEKKQRKR